jgi:hypothetical protein
MSDVSYQYSLTNDFDSCESPALDRLALEIETSAIVTALAVDENGNAEISVLGDTCTIWFKDTLSTGDETLLEETIVADHDGTPLVPDPTVAPVMLEPTGDPNKKLQIVSYEFEANLNGDTTKLIEFSEDREVQGATIEVINHTPGPNGDTFRLGIAAYIGGNWIEVRTLACAHDGDDLNIPTSGKVAVVAEGTATLLSALRIAIKYTSTATTGDKPLINMLIRTWLL